MVHDSDFTMMSVEELYFMTQDWLQQMEKIKDNIAKKDRTKAFLLSKDLEYKKKLVHERFSEIMEVPSIM